MKYARKVDTTQADIVAALRKAGWLVWIISEPCDLLCFRAGQFRTLECKTPRNKAGDPRRDKRQKAQDEFIALTGTPRVTSAEQALKAMGANPPPFQVPDFAKEGIRRVWGEYGIAAGNTDEPRNASGHKSLCSIYAGPAVRGPCNCGAATDELSFGAGQEVER